jgi:tRNA pseudouridine55 synthase
MSRRAFVRSGVLVVDKPAGPTSYDVVALVRRRLGVRRVGHAGTLDPDATGVLPILIGEATKLMGYLAEHDKEYRAVVRLGVRTDTQDLSGRILSELPVPPLTAAEVERVTRRFAGRIRQTPPMYSALHHEGRRLYELAREGVEVEREAREVVVRSIHVEALDGVLVTLRVVCGKGTYVRTLAADVGEAIGCGASVATLTRLRVGPFGLAEAVSHPELEHGPGEALGGRIMPPEAALGDWPAVELDRVSTEAFRHGRALDAHGGPLPSSRPTGGEATLVRVHGPDGVLVGVGAVDGEGGRLRPVRILHADHPRSRVLPA